MREIKFRGRDAKTGRWVYGFYVHLEDPLKKMDVHRIYIGLADSMPKDGGYDFVANYVEVDPATVGQFTGISDISGKEVYEDDIVRYRTGEDRITREPSFEILLINYSEPHSCFQAGNIYWENMISENLEVIGNSHDNPELLSKGL